jgi:hypothetical protein
MMAAKGWRSGAGAAAEFAREGAHSAQQRGLDSSAGTGAAGAGARSLARGSPALRVRPPAVAQGKRKEETCLFFFFFKLNLVVFCKGKREKNCMHACMFV